MLYQMRAFPPLYIHFHPPVFTSLVDFFLLPNLSTTNFIISSETISTNLEVTWVECSIEGDELISISHGLKLSSIKKS